MEDGTEFDNECSGSDGVGLLCDWSKLEVVFIGLLLASMRDQSLDRVGCEYRDTGADGVLIVCGEYRGVGGLGNQEFCELFDCCSITCVFEV